MHQTATALRNDPAFSIRPARPEDAAALAAIERAAFDPKHYGNMMLTKRSFTDHIAGGRNVLPVAVAADGTVIGYSLGFVKKGSPYLRFVSLAVLPAFEGRGAGSALVDALEDYAREHDLIGVRLEVRADNQRLRERYHRRGYRIFTEVDDYYYDGCAAIRMVWTVEKANGKSLPGRG